MIENFKRLFYFPVAAYFRVFANIRLSRWKPKVVVITGSYGKTTLLELVKSGLGSKAKYSDHANSAFGIPFNILGLERKTFQISEWFDLFLRAPMNAFSKIPQENIYVVEADCDRPNEGKFLASLLRPNITLWLSSEVAHGGNFEYVLGRQFESVEDAIAYEYGYFIEYTKDLAIINGDNELIKNETSRTKAEVRGVVAKSLESYKIGKSNSEFIIDGEKFTLKELLPKEVFYSIAMANILFKELGIDSKNPFSNFTQPPGRSSVLSGIKNTTIIDSTYNAPPKGVGAIISMFSLYPSKVKWVVIGDMLELGREEKKLHEDLANTIIKENFDKILLFGPRNSKFTYPVLHNKLGEDKVRSFLSHKDLLDYIKGNLHGEEAILFKGAQGMMLDAVIERLLSDKNEIKKMSRVSKFWLDKKAKLFS